MPLRNWRRAWGTEPVGGDMVLTVIPCKPYPADGGISVARYAVLLDARAGAEIDLANCGVILYKTI